MAVKLSPYWYSIDIRTALCRTKTVMGAVEAKDEFKAMKALENMAWEHYKGRVVRAKLHEIDENGEKCSEPVFVMTPGLPSKEAPKNDDQRKPPKIIIPKSPNPQAASKAPVHKHRFGQGWATHKQAPRPVISLTMKETHNAS